MLFSDANSIVVVEGSVVVYFIGSCDPYVLSHAQG